MNYTLSDVEGRETVLTSTNELYEFIKQPFDYWLAGSGDSSVHIKPGERLVFFKLKEGVFIMQHPDYLSPVIAKDRTAKPLVHYVGGEAFEVPDICICSVQKAFAIIKYYIQTGGKLNPSYTWHVI